MKLALAILFAITASAEVIDLQIVDETHGINFVVPKNRSDIMGLQLSFLPRNPPTNEVTITLSKSQAENMTMTAAEIPESIPDGRVVLGMRWVLTSGKKTKWRLGAFDLWRNPPEEPRANSATVSTPDHSVESDKMVDSELAKAIAENFRKPSDPLPPLPPATNGMQRAYQPTEAQKAMLKFFKEGGAKGRNTQ